MEMGSLGKIAEQARRNEHQIGHAQVRNQRLSRHRFPSPSGATSNVTRSSSPSLAGDRGHAPAVADSREDGRAHGRLFAARRRELALERVSEQGQHRADRLHARLRALPFDGLELERFTQTAEELHARELGADERAVGERELHLVGRLSRTRLPALGIWYSATSDFVHDESSQTAAGSWRRK